MDQENFEKMILIPTRFVLERAPSSRTHCKECEFLGKRILKGEHRLTMIQETDRITFGPRKRYFCLSCGLDFMEQIRADLSKTILDTATVLHIHNVKR